MSLTAVSNSPEEEREKLMSEPENADIVCIGGGVSTTNLIAAKPKGKVTVIMANEFIEWSLAATYFLCKPKDYMQFVSVNKETFELPGANYLYDVVTLVDPGSKEITLRSGRKLRYKVLVVCSGYKLPLINCEIGTTLQQRKALVEAWGAAIAAAKTIVINGAGAIGFEMAADIKVHFPAIRVVVLSRSGGIFNSAYPADVLARLREQIDRLGIEVMKGTVPAAMTEPIREAGVLQLTDADTSSIQYDLFIPAYTQGVNTDFLPREMLQERGAKVVLTNEYLQSTVHPEIFAVGCNSAGEGFSVPLLQKQAKDTAVNAVNFLEGKPMIVHSEPSNAKGLNWGTRPGAIKLGYGPGGYVMFDNVPPCPDKCCLRFCGFPFCPAPCCYPCCGGLQGAFACGWCCGGLPEGQQTMNCFIAVAGIGGAKIFSKNSSMLGIGEAPKGDTMKRE